MVFGLVCFFGICLFVNFNLFYKVISIFDFWCCWYIILLYFLWDYFYILLGGNCSGLVCWYVNFMVIMLLGGLWYGVSWIFVFWGGLYGVYFVINYGWLVLLEKGYVLNILLCLVGNLFSWGIMFFVVVVVWVFFCVESFVGVSNIIVGMMGFLMVYELKFWDSILMGML